ARSGPNRCSPLLGLASSAVGDQRPAERPRCIAEQLKVVESMAGGLTHQTDLFVECGQEVAGNVDLPLTGLARPEVDDVGLARGQAEDSSTAPADISGGWGR